MQLTELRQQLSATQAAAERREALESITRSRDFAAALPEAAAVESMVNSLQRAAVARGVKLVNVQATRRSATEATLGRVELQVQWRGPYPELKAAINEGMQTSDVMILPRLNVRRAAASSAEVVATADIWLLTRPLQLAAGR